MEKETVIERGFKLDCTIDTTIREAYKTGFERGVKWAEKENDPWKSVLEYFVRHDMFCGNYEAKRESMDYIRGVGDVMEKIAYFAEKDEEFGSLFIKNMRESQRMAEGETNDKG